MIRARLLAGCVVLAILGCAGPRPGGDGSDRYPAPPSPMPSYTEVVTRYHANAGKVPSLWARADYTLRWHETTPSGRTRRHTDRGEGNIVLRLPSSSALTVGKLGEIGLWLGSDGDRYWAMHLRPPSGEPRAAFVGRVANLGRPCARSMPGLDGLTGVRPHAIAALLGVARIAEHRNGEAREDGRAIGPVPPAVEWVEGCYMIEPPGLGVRLLIEPRRYLPVRVDLLDDDGYSRVIARLSNHRAMEVASLSPERWPLVAARIELRPTTGDDRVIVTLTDATDGLRDGKIKDRLFDLDRLTRALRIERVLNLDADCP